MSKDLSIEQIDCEVNTGVGCNVINYTLISYALPRVSPLS